MRRFGWVLVALTLGGCTSSYRARVSPGRLMSDFKVTLYSGGVAVREWTSKGVVHSENESDGYYFVDRTTGDIVEVNGTVVIEQVK